MTAADTNDSSDAASRQKPSNRGRIMQAVVGLVVLGCSGYWFLFRHPTPTGLIAEQLRDRTWIWRVPKAGVVDLRLNADGTLQFGTWIGNWNVTGNRLDLTFNSRWQDMDLKEMIDVAIEGDMNVAFRVIEIAPDSVTMHRLTSHGEDDRDVTELTLTLAPEGSAAQ